MVTTCIDRSNLNAEIFRRTNSQVILRGQEQTIQFIQSLLQQYRSHQQDIFFDKITTFQLGQLIFVVILLLHSKCFTEELVDQEKTGYKKAYKWFGKQLEKTKGNSQMHQINSKISSKLSSVAKFDQTIFLTHEFLSPDIRPGHRYKSIPMLVVPKKKKSERKTQTNYKTEEKG